ncbi:MAG: hypothetical protein KC505_02765 [Myxococcales bacterium]|nr:hypothetical protein [Myxococcales bacterium]USN49892.1 MAG: hypothetical protein H6731_06320 [Myxococcales bacterium]
MNSLLLFLMASNIGNILELEGSSAESFYQGLAVEIDFDKEHHSSKKNQGYFYCLKKQQQDEISYECGMNSISFKIDGDPAKEAFDAFQAPENNLVPGQAKKEVFGDLTCAQQTLWGASLSYFCSFKAVKLITRTVDHILDDVY